jgi:hypothetical protein
VDSPKIVVVIRSDVKKTVRFENAINRTKEFGSEQSASMMPAFRPWIRKEHV